MFGTIRKLYRNTLFRLSLLGALLFVLSLFVALGYIYYATIESELRRVDRANEAEITELQEFYDRAGGRRSGSANWNDWTVRVHVFTDRATNLPSKRNAADKYARDCPRLVIW